jgi:hypothetical protein
MGGRSPRFSWRGAWGPTVGIAVAALAAGLLLGFMGRHRQASLGHGPPRAAAALSSVPAAADTIIATGNACAVQLGHTLQLGVEIANQSDRAVALRQVRAVLPLGGLRETGSGPGPCGALAGPGTPPPAALGPGATGWLHATFDVLVRCPGPLPVGFRVGYAQGGQLASADLSPFPDLSQVPYRGCKSG